MNSEPAFLEPDYLLSHDGWLRALVRELVSDEADVDDVLQSTWMTALENPPQKRGDSRSERSWLSRVARNFALRQRRGEARRRDREDAVASERPESGRSTQELVQQVEAQRKVAAFVLDLDEPYRTTLLLRYFEDLSSAAIAERQGVPLATVRTRVQRGLERLREQLQRADGARWRHAYAVAILGLPAGASGATKALIPGVLLMLKSNAKTLAAAALVVGLGFGAWAMSQDPNEPGLPAGEPSRTLTGESAQHEPSGEGKAAGSAGQQPERREMPSTPRGSRVNTIRVVGRVLDRLGRPVPGAEISLRSSAFQDFGTPAPSNATETLAASAPRVAKPTARVVYRPDPARPIGKADAAGRFDLRCPAHTGVLCAADTGDHYTLQAHAVRSLTAEGKLEDHLDCILVVAPCLSISGIVVDPAGKPLAGVRYAADVKGLRDFPHVLDANVHDPIESETGADGAFSLLLGDAPEAFVRFDKSGYQRFELTSGVARGADLEGVRVQLKVFQGEPDTRFSGVVVDSLSRPVKGAVVGVEKAQTTTNALGRFRLAVAARIVQQDLPLFAYRRGMQPALFAGTRDRAWRSNDQRVEGLRLVLAGPALALRGEVVDHEGKPIPGVFVYLWDPTDVAESALDCLEEKVSPQRHSEYGVGEETDARGRFRIEGLANRPYVLRIQHKATRWTHQTKAFRPSSNEADRIVIRVPADAVREQVRGRVVSPAGDPVSDAKVFVRTDVRATVRTRRHGNGPEVLTDAKGRFELRKVSRHHAVLRIEGKTIIPRNHERVPTDPGTDVRLTVERRCHFKASAGSFEGQRSLSVHAFDANGKALDLYRFSPWGHSNGKSMSLDRGAVAVSELVRELRLVQTTITSRGERVQKTLATQQVRLEPGQIIKIRF